jgi:hypothetical protein
MTQLPTFYRLMRPDSDAQYRITPGKFDEGFAKASWTEASVDFATIGCPINPMHTSVNRTIKGSPSAVLESGKRGDVAWTGYGDLLIGRRMLELLHKERLSGFVVRSVNMVNGQEMYWLQASGWAGMAATDSTIYREYYYKCCGHVHYKIIAAPPRIVEPSRWDGSDFFIVWPMPMYIFVTERIVNLLSEWDIRGVAYVPETHAVRRSDSFSPGKLSDYMDGHLALSRGLSSHISEV